MPNEQTGNHNNISNRKSNDPARVWVHPAVTRPDVDRADRPAGVFASYATPNRPTRVSRKSMFSIYVGLLAVAAAFGVFAAYQWERGEHAREQAVLTVGQSVTLAQRVKELESLGEGLAEMVALAYEREPRDLLARLDEMEERRPDAAGTEIFTKLWIGAKDRELQASSPEEAPFETASGGDPTQSDIKMDPAPDPKAEPARQDQAKGEPLPAEPTSSPAPDAPAGDTSASVDPIPPDITIVAKAESWVQIVDANGSPVFTKLMKAGDEHTVTPGAGITLITGNPTGLALSVDGIVAPAFNAKGPTRREIALDPARLLDGTAELRK